MTDTGSQHDGSLSRCPATLWNICVRKNVRYAKAIVATAVVALSMVVFVPPSAAQPAPVTSAASDPKPSPATSSRQSREEAAARSSRAQDMRGPLPSLYRGRYFHADQESFRLCVAAREGSNTYMVRGGGGNNYYGTYQMSAALVRGASWMMAAESRATKDGLRQEARSLLTKPGNKWSRYWQDRAFYTILNHDYKWSGKGHWAGGRFRC